MTKKIHRLAASAGIVRDRLKNSIGVRRDENKAWRRGFRTRTVISSSRPYQPKRVFRGSIGGPPVPLSTLHPRCRHRWRMTRGQRGRQTFTARLFHPQLPARFIPALSDSHMISILSQLATWSRYQPFGEAFSRVFSRRFCSAQLIWAAVSLNTDRLDWLSAQVAVRRPDDFSPPEAPRVGIETAQPRVSMPGNSARRPAPSQEAVWLAIWG